MRMTAVPSPPKASGTSVWVRMESVRWQRAFASDTLGTETVTSAVSVTLLSSE